MSQITIPGTPDDYVSCSYDDLCGEARQAIDAIVNSHSLGMKMTEPVAMALLRFLGMQEDEASDLLADARQEASQH